MVAVGVELLFGRYHATAWGRAANEGDVEWPPSPWRLARALVDAWHRLPVDGRPGVAAVDELLQALAPAPRFLLPRGSIGQTRHYMPEASGKATSSPVLDAFVRVTDPHLTMVWDDVTLPPTQAEALRRLLEGVGYLGRAESACVATMVEDPGSGVEVAAAADEGGARDGDLVHVLCLTQTASLSDLSQSTAERRLRRVDAAPGGRWVVYSRPRNLLVPRRPTPRRRDSPEVALMRFSLEGPALPPLTDALRIAELVRAAALRRVDDSKTDAVELLRGRSAASDRPLEGHRHCHYLLTDEDGDGRVDHLSVWCPAGLTREARGALDIERLRSWRLDHPVGAVLTEARTSRDLPEAGPTAIARVWESHTPFIATRYPKRRRGRIVDSIEDQIHAELAHRGFPEPRAVAPLRPTRRAWGAFRRVRDGVEAGTRLPVSGWRLEFADAIQGPIALGRYSHFGMGLFLPVGRE